MPKIWYSEIPVQHILYNLDMAYTEKKQNNNESSIHPERGLLV